MIDTKCLSTLCLLYDEVADCYSALMTFTNEASAVRWFANKCAGDFAAPDLKLYNVGTFDSKTGAVVLLENNVLLARGIDYVKKEEA